MMAAEAGQMELNAFEPVVFYDLFESITAMTGAVKTLTENCVIGITANAEHCLELEESSTGIATALCPTLGYKKSAEIAKKALKEGTTVRAIVLREGLMAQPSARSCFARDSWMKLRSTRFSPRMVWITRLCRRIQV